MIKSFILMIAVMLICGDTTQPKIQDRPRILFLGSQITQGINDPSKFGFRDHAQELLGVGVWDCVGPFADPESHQVFDVHHAGRDDDSAHLVRDRTPKLLKEFMDPNAKNDWVLIYVGTRDILESTSLEAKFKTKEYDDVWLEMIKMDIKGLIEIINEFNPHIRIALAKIIPCRHREYNEKIKELNRRIEKMAQIRKRFAGENDLFLADMYKIFITTPNWGEKLMSNRWYPSEQGYELMAYEWVRVIKQANAELAPGRLIPNDR